MTYGSDGFKFCEKVENIVGKKENSEDQHFLVSHNLFKSLLSGLLKISIVC